MTFQNKENQKIFYKIGEVAKELNVNVSLIRFWEKEFDILNPKKNKKGNRLFTTKDFNNLKIIYHLVKERGFTLDGAKKKLRENKEDTTDNISIVSHLKEIRKFLVELREQL
jgi:DNA-binding transcriptional MerR regulator|tara:strand:- start:6846 stop:7181 length:336 start_codon:yes stop_codon:yes gene_type:complete